MARRRDVSLDDLRRYVEQGTLNYDVNSSADVLTRVEPEDQAEAIRLYLAVKFDATATGNTATFNFDNDHSGPPNVVGDDVLLRNTTTFTDSVRSATHGVSDISLGGTNDGDAAFSNSGGSTVYEFSHPLDSADDAHDFSIGPGDTLGFNLFVRLIATGLPVSDTVFPQAGDGDIIIAPVPATITFDDLAGQSQHLNGEYPAGLIHWGNNDWWHSAPHGQFDTKSTSFDAPGIFSESLRFLVPAQVIQVDFYNGSDAPSVVSLACAGQPTVGTSMPADAIITLATNWTSTCTEVTVSSSEGWDTNLDNLVVAVSDGPTPTLTATPPGPTATFTPTPSPTATPHSPTVTPSATPTPPGPTATFTPTPTPTATPSCEVRVRINGVEQWLPRPAEFCQ